MLYSFVNHDVQTNQTLYNYDSVVYDHETYLFCGIVLPNYLFSK